MTYAPAKYWTEERVIAAIHVWAARHDGEPPRAQEWSRATPEFPAHQTVTRLFGRWNVAIEEAGFEPRPNHGCGRYERWTRARVAEAFLDFVAREGRWPTSRDCGVPGVRRGKRKPGLPDWRTVYRKFGSWDEAKRFAGWNGERILKEAA